PDGSTVYAAGQSLSSSGTSTEFVTVANDAASGDQLWVARYPGPGEGPNSSANALAVSADGARVFVTGRSRGEGGVDDYATVAYDAATGDQLWVSRYDGPTGGHDAALAVAVAPDGSAVFVTGLSQNGIRIDYATVAYDAATGDQLWVARYDGPAGNDDDASAVAVSPDGATVFVTGRSLGGATGNDYATIAYDAASGDEPWVARYDGPAGSQDFATALAVAPDGGTVIVTGRSFGVGTATDYATVAYDAASGDELWVARYDGPARGQDAANALSVSPDGARVYVT